MGKILKIVFTLIGIFILGAIALESFSNKEGEKAKNFSVKFANRKDYNLIFISIDTLRADRLGMYGYQRETSPNLDNFAKKAVLFEHAVSVSSWTLPTHVSFFTGMFPSVHGVNRPAKLKVDAKTEMLAEITKRAGYRNFAYTGGGYVGGIYGFDRGFEHYGTHKGKKRDGDYDIDGSLDGIKSSLSSLKTDEKFFVFFHTFDAHCPYNSPMPYMAMFKSDDAEYVDPYKCGTNYYNKRQMTPGNVKYISDRYDGGIRWVDTKIQELFDFLNEKALMDKTIIVITSDHGEEFQEHGSIGHKRSLYRELIRVPLMIYAPGIEPGRISQEVSTVDLFQTLVEAMELKTEQVGNGISLWPLLNSKNPEDYKRKFQFSELDGEVTLRSHIDGDGHLIENKNKNSIVYFNLKDDLHEQEDLSEQAEAEVAKRTEELRVLQDSFKKQEAGVLEGQTKEEVERLKSLGYL